MSSRVQLEVLFSDFESIFVRKFLLLVVLKQTPSPGALGRFLGLAAREQVFRRPLSPEKFQLKFSNSGFHVFCWIFNAKSFLELTVKLRLRQGVFLGQGT